jgi:dihydroorotate dehydrogenase (fumarate)
MTDLSTTWLGLKLRNPIVVSSSSLTGSLDKLKEAEAAGVGGVVLKSIFEEQLTLEAQEIESKLQAGAGFQEATSSYFADIPMDYGPADYLKLIGDAKKGLKIPVVASINCISAGSWSEYAKKIEGAGADAIELNLYFLPTDPKRSGGDIEKVYLDVVHDVRKRTRLPISVKLHPFLTSIPHMVARIAEAGANGVTLFNRFYQPNFDVDKLEIANTLQLSRPEDALLPLRWIAILYGRVKVDFAATSGIHDGRAVVKMILAGASVTQVASVIFKHKTQHVGEMLRELEGWMKEKEYASVADFRGMLSQKSNPDPAAFERAQYIKTLVGHD